MDDLNAHPRRAYPPRDIKACRDEVTRLGGIVGFVLQMCDEADRAGQDTILVGPIRDVTGGTVLDVYRAIRKDDPPD